MDFSNTSSDAVAALRIKIPTVVLEAMTSGKLVVTSTHGAMGSNVYVNFLDAAVGHNRYSLDQAVELLKLADGKGEGAPVATPPSSPETKKEKMVPGANNRTVRFSVVDDIDHGKSTIRMNYHEAAEIVNGRNLNFHRVNGVKNKYPDGSLVRQDFKRQSLHDFVARVTYVASCLTSAKAVSRIASDRTLRVDGVFDLNSWWESSTDMQKARLLSSPRYLNPFEVDLQRFTRCECPFEQADLDFNDSE